MGFLASVGMLAIICLVIYLGLRYASNQDSIPVKTNDRNNQLYIEKIKSKYLKIYRSLPDRINYKILMPYSEKCRDILNEHSRLSKTSELPPAYPYRKLKKALRDPYEFWTSLDRYLDKVELDAKIEVERRKEQEISMRYSEFVYSVFSPNKYCSSNEIHLKIHNTFNYDLTRSLELIDTWVENRLLRRIGDSDFITFIEKINDNGYDVIYEISNDFIIRFIESDSITSYYEWLNSNGLKLVDNWKEYFNKIPKNN